MAIGDRVTSAEFNPSTAFSGGTSPGPTTIIRVGEYYYLTRGFGSAFYAYNVTSKAYSAAESVSWRTNANAYSLFGSNGLVYYDKLFYNAYATNSNFIHVLNENGVRTKRVAANIRSWDGAYTDGTTLWLATLDSGNSKFVYNAYVLSTLARDSGKDKEFSYSLQTGWSSVRTILGSGSDGVNVYICAQVVLSDNTRKYFMWVYNFANSAYNTIFELPSGFIPGSQFLVENGILYVPNTQYRGGSRTGVYAFSISEVVNPDPPTTPKKLTGVSGTKQVTLSWEAVSEADDYEIRYRIGTGAYTTVIDITATGYLVTGLAGGNTYSFSVRAGNSGGFSAWSSEITAAVPLGFGDRVPSKDISAAKLRAAISSISPFGIWSDGITMWVASNVGPAIYAYVLATGARDSNKDITRAQLIASTGSSSLAPRGMWSDGTTLWVVDAVDFIRAYVLATGARDSSKDITRAQLRAANASITPDGIWSDGTTIWVTDNNRDTVWAYVLSTGARDSSKDITRAQLYEATSNIRPTGMWSDGVTLWIADDGTDGIWAFVLATGVRDSSKDITQTQLRALNSNITPKDIWSDGISMWVLDNNSDTIFTFNIAQGPPVPTGLAGTSTDKTIVATWNAVDGATAYDIRIKQGSSGSYTVTEDITGTQHTFTGLTASTDYRFSIRAKNGSGTSEWSLDNRVDTKAPAPKPATPTGLAGSAGSGQVTLTWTAVTAAVDYDIRYKIGALGSYTTITGVTGTRRIITGLTNGSDYRFEIRSSNANGDSPWSTAVAVTPKALEKPSAPTGLAGVSGDGRITLSWTAVSGALQYDIRYQVGAGPFTVIQDIQSTGYIVINLVNGTDYKFQVRSENNNGEGAWSTAVTLSPTAPPKPGVPTNFTGVAGDTRVTLRWDAVDKADMYDLRYQVGNGAFTVFEDIETTGRVVTGLTNNTAYKFQVRSENENGASAWTTAITITPVPTVTPGNPPEVPVALVGIPGDQQVILAWSAEDEASDYDLRYQKRGAGVWTEVNNILETSHTVTDLDNKATYSFQVRANNDDGTSDWTPETKIIPDVDTVRDFLPPGVVVASPANEEVRLIWNVGLFALSYDIRWKLGSAKDYGKSAVPVWEKFSRGTTVTTNPTATIDARTVDANKDTTYASPDPWELDSFTVSDTEFILKTTLNLKDNNRWRNIKLKADASGADDAVLFSLQRTDGTELRRIAAHSLASAMERTSGTYTIGNLAGAYGAANADGDYEFNLVIYYIAKGSPAGLTNLSLGYQKEDGTNVDPVVLSSTFDKLITSDGDGNLISDLTETTHLIEDLENGTLYNFQVRSSGPPGLGKSEWSAPISATPFDPEALNLPTPPSLLVGVPGNTEITVSWPRVDFADEYDLRWKVGELNPWTTVEDISETTHTLTNLTNRSTHSIQVRSKNTSHTSDWSYEIYIIPFDPAKVDDSPQIPTPVLAIPGNAEAIVAWGHAENAAAYDLRYRAAGAVTYSIVEDIAITVYTITGLDNATTYEVQVRSTDGTDNSKWSTPATVTPFDPFAQLPPPVIPPPQAPPPIPGTLKLVPDANSISLTWQEAPRANSYDIRFRESTESEWHTVTDVLNEAYVITGLLHNVSYDVAVRALNVFGASLWTEPEQATTTVLVAPETPENFMATAGDTQITLTWDVSELATTYIITGQLSDESEPAFTIDSLDDFDTPYIVDRLNNGEANINLPSSQKTQLVKAIHQQK